MPQQNKVEIPFLIVVLRSVKFIIGLNSSAQSLENLFGLPCWLIDPAGPSAIKYPFSDS